MPVATRIAEAGWGLADDRTSRCAPARPSRTLAALKTPFRPHGRVTAGNAAGINDGATAALLADEETARELGLPVKMRLVTYAFAGVEPEVMGAGPIPATEKALRQAGLTIDDIGAFEVNEAFAVQVLAFLEHFGIADDDPRVNPYGGAIADGPPAGLVRRTPDEPAGPRVRGAPRGPLRPHHHVHRHRHGRHRDLGEPALDRQPTRRPTRDDRRPPTTRALPRAAADHGDPSPDAERVTRRASEAIARRRPARGRHDRR